MDLLLDENTHDLVFVNGECPTTQDQKTKVAQRLKVRLQTFLGEYFINTSIGIPYYQKIFGKVRNKSTVDIIFQTEILADDGVIEIVSYSSDITTSSRLFSITFAVRTSDGVTDDITIGVGV